MDERIINNEERMIDEREILKHIIEMAKHINGDIKLKGSRL